MKYFIFSLVLAGTVAAHGGSTTECTGSSITNDGVAYKNIALTARFKGDQGTYDLYADGHNEKFEYDIQNRFKNLPFVGVTQKNGVGRVIQAHMAGPFLPGKRIINMDLDLATPQSMAKVEIQRVDGNFIRAYLTCKSSLEPFCYEKQTCYNHCYAKSGCDAVRCTSKRVCNPIEF